MKYIPNTLTLLRLLMIPFYFVVFYSDHPDSVMQAMYIFILASVTDVLDGYLARKYDVVSKFGMVADPFADKMMQLSVLFTLSHLNILENWFFWFILFKEALQIGLGLVMVSMKPRMIIPANIFGKITTVMIFITIIIAVLDFSGAFFIQVVVNILAIITVTQYAYQFIKELKKREVR
ncbi:CDP-diacylglycerol--glycerol-3-phosphate 3-phosphatidyltransferase [Jeotgalibaca sp. MA1X17-3]|uniref:CDP-diacylglycerol--glycerol-3-phosphate 3-phosphatidyltransferase n=1 Tax=Jeotgalibaca sp. MA1X17-3 TaxID=2908211 RepID=UPI001F16853B|nr:CDP-diacylglycerol--glycerol-3-phosphate 3-phosphatidyltransferase [Jeotgalibaca sp. MA1X17-3]UJF16167.1 CDP-diacylglycerol--glycerol-3-phosphate 3-phosphatidyltransferase [Jeotgalibaca sp. MA1X17-3]